MSMIRKYIVLIVVVQLWQSVDFQIVKMVLSLRKAVLRSVRNWQKKARAYLVLMIGSAKGDQLLFCMYWYLYYCYSLLYIILLDLLFLVILIIYYILLLIIYIIY